MLKHLSIIMDGNGRWAQAKGMPRVFGHKNGAKVARDMVLYCSKKGIEALSLWAFAIENWGRPDVEVSYLMELFYDVILQAQRLLNDNDISLRILGDRERFSPKLKAVIDQVELSTAANKGMKLLLAISYSGSWDIVQALQSIALKVKLGALAPSQICEQTVSDHMVTAGMPDPDLVIRTGCEHRISNYFLWQIKYAELYFPDVLWPDFTEDALEQALNNYKLRKRRFGLLP